MTALPVRNAFVRLQVYVENRATSSDPWAFYRGCWNHNVNHPDVAVVGSSHTTGGCGDIVCFNVDAGEQFRFVTEGFNQSGSFPTASAVASLVITQP